MQADYEFTTCSARDISGHADLCLCRSMRSVLSRLPLLASWYIGARIIHE
jgi:hypothetical protein